MRQWPAIPAVIARRELRLLAIKAAKERLKQPAALAHEIVEFFRPLRTH